MPSLTSCLISLTAASVSSAVQLNLGSETLVDVAVNAAREYALLDRQYYNNLNVYLEGVLDAAPNSPPTMSSSEYYDAHHGPVSHAFANYLASIRAIGLEVGGAIPDDILQARGPLVSNGHYKSKLLELYICKNTLTLGISQPQNLLKASRN